MSTHTEHAARVGVSVPCTAAHVNFGGGCLNCGYAPVWKIKPGNIACVCLVTTPEGVEHTCIYMDEGKPVEVGVLDEPKFRTFPMEVQATVNRHFGTVFALPVERRGWYLQLCTAWEVTPA